jgi:hypothetical protein
MEEGMRPDHAVREICRICGQPCRTGECLGARHGQRLLSPRPWRATSDARERPASSVIANNVLAHVDDLRDVLRGLDALLADDGMFAAEVPYLGDLIDAPRATSE